MTKLYQYHGMYDQPIYKVWTALKQRCLNDKCEAFPNYGGRGILLHPAWLDFLIFNNWAESTGYKTGLTLDRINNDGHYYPENCRWVHREYQLRNTRRNISLTAFGETKLQVDWKDDPRCRTSYTTFRRRIKQGWNVEKALTTLSNKIGKGA